MAGCGWAPPRTPLTVHEHDVLRQRRRDRRGDPERAPRSPLSQRDGHRQHRYDDRRGCRPPLANDKRPLFADSIGRQQRRGLQQGPAEPRPPASTPTGRASWPPGAYRGRAAARTARRQWRRHRHPPAAGESPAIDAGSSDAPGYVGACAPADQRGAARPVDGDGDGIATCDLGAVEVAAATPGDADGDRMPRRRRQLPADRQPRPGRPQQRRPGRHCDDEDGDGITDADELAAGTNPDAADTDGDGDRRRRSRPGRDRIARVAGPDNCPLIANPGQAD